MQIEHIKADHLCSIKLFNPFCMNRKLNLRKDLVVKSRTCVRCNGTGYLPQFKHVENGICFKCRGSGAL